MDMYIHTLLATGCMFGSFIAGKYFGRREGFRDMISVLLGVFNADSLEITEEGDFFVTNEGNTSKVN